MSENPYQSPSDVADPEEGEVAQDSGQSIDERTLRLWILPVGMIGLVLGFALGIFLLSVSTVLHAFPGPTLSLSMMLTAVATLWIAAVVFEG